jgi:hypothetical protein
MQTFMQAIARQEGFYTAGTLASRRNNPGNIVEGAFARTHGALHTDGSRFAAWSCADWGFAAMRELLTMGYMGLTVAEAIAKWAPEVENDTNNYIKDVCLWTGLTPNTVLTAENIG